MQARLAKKIVQRVQSGLANHLSYPRPQVEDAFRVMGVPLTADLLKPWTDQAQKVQDDPVARLARQEANRRRWEQAVAYRANQHKERSARRVAGAARAARMATTQTGILADHVQGEALFAVDMAVAAGRAAFEQTMQKGRVPKSIEIVPQVLPVSMSASVEAPEPDLAAMTVDELKDLAKARGLKGNSTKKKADLIAMLTAS